MPVETAWLTRSAMLIPFERMRVGMSSERASQTQMPGPEAKKAMKLKMNAAVSQPLRSLGTGVTRAFSMSRGAARACWMSAHGLEKNATTLLGGTHASREIRTGAAASSSERTALVAARKPPKE